MSTLGIARKGLDLAVVAPIVLVVLFGLAAVLISWETIREAILDFLGRIRARRVQKGQKRSLGKVG